MDLVARDDTRPDPSTCVSGWKLGNQAASLDDSLQR